MKNDDSLHGNDKCANICKRSLDFLAAGGIGFLTGPEIFRFSGRTLGEDGVAPEATHLPYNVDIIRFAR